MYIDLLDKKKNNQLVRLDVTVEYTTPSPHLLLVAVQHDLTTTLENGQESGPYAEYVFRPLHHLAGVKFKYEGRIYALTLGFYLAANGLLPAIVDHPTSDARFANWSLDGTFEEYTLINKQEYEWLSQLGLTKLSFQQYVTKVIDADDFKPWSRIFYDITPEIKEEFDIQDLVDEERFHQFLDKN